MKTTLSKTQKAILVLTVTMAASASTQAAGYIKFDGIDGEMKVKQSATVTQQSNDKKADERRGITLPAVQKVRQKDNTSRQAGDEHEITYDLSAGV